MSLKIAIIDDGINDTFYSITQPLNHLISKDGNIVNDSIRHINPNSHGSCCAAIFCKYLVYPVEIFSIKVLHNGLGNCVDLINAMLWCEKNNIDLINMSVGTVDLKDGKEIEKFINESQIIKRIKLIAAYSNKSLYTYPASLPGVIGVRSNIKFRNSRIKVISNSLDSIEIHASSIHTVSLNDQSKKLLAGANSFAAPLVSSKICNFLSLNKDVSVNEILENL